MNNADAAFRLIVRYSAAYPDLKDYEQHILTLQREPAEYTPRIPDDHWQELRSLGGNALMFYPTIPEPELLEELIEQGYTIYYGSHWVPLHFRARYGVDEGDGRLLDHLREVNSKHPHSVLWGCASESGINQPDVRWLTGLPEPGTFTTKADAYGTIRNYYLEQVIANTSPRHFFYSQKRLPNRQRDLLFNQWRAAGCPRVDGMRPYGFGDVSEHAHETGAEVGSYNLVAGDGTHTHTFHYMRSFGARRVQGEFNAGCPPCQPSVAFLRAAAKMSGIEWMIHWSAWGGNEGAAQSYDQEGNLRTGYSPSVQLRQWVFGWLAGANMMTGFEEASRQAWYHDRQGRRHLTQSSQNMKKFSKLALTDGLPGLPATEPVKPYVPFAVMLERHHGWSPGHDDIWWGAAPWTADEDNIRAFFDAAWPSHRWFIGGSKRYAWQRTAGCPWKDTPDYYRLRADGLRPDDFEKGQMSQTRWGDTFDAITEDASPDVLSQYKVIVLLGGIKLSAELRIRLRDYVDAGGTVVVNAPQINRSSEDWLGVRLGHIPPRSRNEGLPFDIALAGAEKVELAGPSPIATPDGAAYPAPNTNPPFAVRIKHGKGEAYLTTLDCSLPGAMALYLAFFDDLLDRHLPVRLESDRPDQTSWMLNAVPNGWVLTVMNHGCDYWRTGVASTPCKVTGLFADLPGSPTATDLWTGASLPIRKEGDGCAVELEVEAYGFVICAVC